MSNGNENRHKMAAAVYGIFRDGNKVLFVRRAHTNYMDGKLGLPAGHVEKNESIDEALAREVREEVGINVEKKSTKLIFTGHRYEVAGEYDYADYYFEVTRWCGEPKNGEPKKHSEVIWTELGNPDIIDYLQQVFQDIAEGKSYSSILRNDN